MTDQRRADVAASFQEAVVDVLVGKARQTLQKYAVQTLCVGGGVAANSRLRVRLEEMAEEIQVELIVAPMEFCTDNAGMAAIAWELLRAGRVAELDLDVTPGLVRKRK
jgi:N6-L-threonylcarbamoyladenine synthase